VDGDKGSSLYYQSFASPATTNATLAQVSQHSSPGSAGLPSPTMSNLDPSTEPSPRLSNTFNTLNNPITPITASSPARFDYDYAMQPSPLSQTQTTTQQWNGGGNGNGNGQDGQTMDVFPSAPQDAGLYVNSFGYGSTIEGGYSGYEGTSDLTLAGLSTTPPGTSFAVTGLPFRGLDYIRNYNPGGFNASGEQDSLWQSYDPGAFGFDPDLPFTIGDPVSEIQDPTLH